MKRLLPILIILLLLSHTNSYGQLSIDRGSGSFIYDNYLPLSHKPIRVRYYIPTKGDIKTMAILFAMPEAKRDGVAVITQWKEFAERDNFIVISPEFSTLYYYTNQYQYGGITFSISDRRTKPKEEWSYSIIEPLFDYIKEITGNQSERYDMQGHSAGAQWVHRFVLAVPTARIRVAIASNSGNYTFPYTQGLLVDDWRLFGWPYSLKESPFTTDHYLQSWFSQPLIIHTGSNDTSTKGRGVPTDPQSLKQGANRHERALNFYNECLSLAKEKGVQFNWQLIVVNKIGHSGAGMIYGARQRTADGKAIYSTDLIDKSGAYYLLYGDR